jgi:PASTA domain
VSNTIAAPTQPGQRAKRGGSAGRQLVGEYVGEPAGQAAQAVRRSGLRPGLDRSFDCPPELVGRVVAQDPPGGSELGRNGLVTLFVAAPGAGPQDEPEAPPANPEQNVSATMAGSAPRRARRRRKAGLAGTGQSFSASVSPAPSLDRSAGAVDTETTAVDTTDDLRAIEDFGATEIAPADAHPEGSFDGSGVPDEEFVIYADDVFAGRARPVWRRAYPRRQGSPSLRSRFAGHQRLVKAALALLAVWMVVALAAMLAGSPAGRHRTRVASSAAGRAEIHPRRPPAPAPIIRRPRAKPPRTRRKRPDAERLSRAPAGRPAPPAVVSGNAETSKRASVQIPVPAQPGPTPPTAASAPPAAARQKTEGGLFSP